MISIFSKMAVLSLCHSTKVIIYIFTFSLNEPDLWKYSLVSAAGKEGLSNYMQLALDARTVEREYPFIVFDKQANAYAGSTRFYDINFPFKTLQLGYTWYGKDFQGLASTGIANISCCLLHLKIFIWNALSSAPIITMQKHCSNEEYRLQGRWCAA